MSDRPAWHDAGLCAQTDPDAFYPDKGQPTAPAKRICAACPVRTLCLDHAITNDERHGIWGGTSPNERRHLRRAPAATSSPHQRTTAA